MSYVLEILGKARILKNGRALIGFVFLISGVVILLDGAGRIRELWAQLAPYFPFALPKQAGESILQSLPRIFATFVSGVGSVSAVLFGGVWLLSGIGEVFRKEKTALEPPDLAQPEFVAESLAGAEAKYRKLPSFPMRILTAMVPRVRLSGPVALSMATSLFGSMIKIVLAAFLIGFFGYLLQLIPGLVQKYLHKAIIVAVPSPRPLYLVLGFLFILNGLIALSLLLRKRNEFVRGRESLPVNGTGDPHLFLALVEEGCKLLSGKGFVDKRPVRFQLAGNPAVKGSLIECFSEQVRFFAHPAAYCCLPLIFFFLTMGFSRLIHFRRIPLPMPYEQFLSFQALDWVMEVAFALALILAGVYVADKAAKLFRIRRFQSDLVFCRVGPRTPPSVEARTGRGLSRSGDSEEQTWMPVEGVDPLLANWAKNPKVLTSFQCEIFWSRVMSETLVEEDNGRFLIAMQASAGLDEALRRIVLLPFHVNFDSSARGGTPLQDPPVIGGTKYSRT